MDVDKLEGRELNMAVAENVMEWPKWLWGSMDFCEDIKATWMVEERIEELGLVHQYCINLVMVVCNYKQDYHAILRMGRGLYDEQLFAIIHASPEDRCRAALKAVEDK